MATICVYCSASDSIPDAYPVVAEALGREIGGRGHDLIYGGGTVGLMGVVARTVHDEGGTVTGVIPERLKEREGIAYNLADELIVTESMRERKRIMFTRADAFVVLPGGFGTLEEFLEVLTLKQLGYHGRPILLINPEGFYDPLLAFFRRLQDDQFAHRDVETMIDVVSSPGDALDRIAAALPVDGAA